MRILLIILLMVLGLNAFAQNETIYNQVFDSVSKHDKQKEGIVYFESELKKFPKNEFVLRSLGALNLQLGNFKETKTFYNKALEVNPECAKCYFYISQAMANENDFDGAYRALEKGIGINPKEGSLYLLRGKLKMHQGNEISGLNDLSKAISVEPDNAVYYLERADYYLKKENYFTAKNDLLKAQKVDPENLLIYNKLAEVYTYDRNFESALASINQALAIDSLDVKSIMTRGAVYSSIGNVDAAMKEFEKVIRLTPQNYMAHYYLSEAYYQLEKMDDFCTSITESIRLIEEQKINDPDFYSFTVARQKNVCDSSTSSYYYQRGIAAFNSGEYQKAISWYDQGIEKFPGEYMTYSFKANAQLHLKESRKAVDNYLRSLKNIDQVAGEMLKNPKYSTGVSRDSMELFRKGFESATYLSLAFCYFNLGNPDSALKCVDYSILQTPDLPEFASGDSHFMQGVLLLDKGRFSEAEKAFTEAARRSPDWSGCEDYIALSLIAQAKNTPLSRSELQMRELKDLGELHWNLPPKMPKGSEYFNRALLHAEKALQINREDAFALYLRGFVNRQLGKNACTDFLKANQAGYPVELNFLKECK
ncbi:tetratricopeptide repeat protein [compost metagenome]